MQRERRRGQWERLCQRFLCDSPRLLLGGGTRLSPSQGDRGGSQPLAVSRSIGCLLGSGVLMIHPGTSAELPHRRPYTAGFSVSGATLSVQASFLFFPAQGPQCQAEMRAARSRSSETGATTSRASL